MASCVWVVMWPVLEMGRAGKWKPVVCEAPHTTLIACFCTCCFSKRRLTVSFLAVPLSLPLCAPEWKTCFLFCRVYTASLLKSSLCVDVKLYGWSNQDGSWSQEFLEVFGLSRSLCLWEYSASSVRTKSAEASIIKLLVHFQIYLFTTWMSNVLLYNFYNLISCVTVVPGQKWQWEVLNIKIPDLTRKTCMNLFFICYTAILILASCFRIFLKNLKSAGLI